MPSIISVQDYVSLKNSGASHVLLDVREPDEWNEGHLANAVLLPQALVPLKIRELVPDPRTTVVTYCRSGGRAGMAAQALASLGYADVRAVQGGGYEELKAAGA